MVFLRQVVREFFWSIGWAYIPDRDAAPYILPIIDRNDNDIPDHLEEPTEPVQTGYPVRWDGVEGSPDYTDWQYKSDGIIWSAKKYRAEYKYAEDGSILPTIGNNACRRSYMEVRPLVCAGRSNTQIAAATGRSLSWAESYASDVRRALEMRYDEEHSTPPLSTRGGAKTLEL